MTSFFLDQHGCAKNQVDGELIISKLTQLGLTRVSSPEEAKIIVINSCGFIESAKKESLDSLMNARRSYPNAKIVLAGCLAQRYAELFKNDLPEADAIFGTGDISAISTLISELEQGNRPIVIPPQTGVCSGDRKDFLSFPSSTFVKITEGCNNCCSFCAIPIIRGQLRSRKISEIISEIKNLLSRGFFEINLVGQDLAAFGTDYSDSTNAESSKSALPELLKEISALAGDFWIRLLYIHPDHFSPSILPIIASDKRILPYFDIPFQSGDDSIIHAMNRKGSSKSYLELIKTIREALPSTVLRTTFLTGFPGETPEAFENTKNFLKALRPHWSGAFDFSREDGTVADKLKKQVPKKIAKERASELQEIQTKITAELMEQHKNNIYQVLIEELVQGDEGIAIGRAWFQSPDVDGAVVVRFDIDDSNAVSSIVPGKTVQVKIVGCTGIDLDGIYTGKSL